MVYWSVFIVSVLICNWHLFVQLPLVRFTMVYWSTFPLSDYWTNFVFQVLDKFCFLHISNMQEVYDLIIGISTCIECLEKRLWLILTQCCLKSWVTTCWNYICIHTWPPWDLCLKLTVLSIWVLALHWSVTLEKSLWEYFYHKFYIYPLASNPFY